MNAKEIISKLALSNIDLYLEDNEKLKAQAPKGAITAEFANLIKSNKTELIDYLRQLGSLSGSDTPEVTIEKAERNGDILPVSFAQQRLWFINSLQGQTSEYNMPMAFDVKGLLDTQLLNRVFLTIIERHEVLRSVYLDQQGQTRQRIVDIKDVDFAIEQIDLSHLKDDALEQSLQAQVKAQVAKPFDLTQDLMLRICYIKRNDENGVLVFNMHHIASDGWSMEVLTKEFIALYSAFSQGNENPLPPLAIQYGDFAHWQSEHLPEQGLEKQLDYWAQQLADLPVLHSLPLDFPRPESKQYQGEIFNATVEGDLAKNLLEVAKQHKMTPFMLLHGALSLLISRHSNSQDIVIGTPVAGRKQPELEPLIGFFVNTLVLRANTGFDNAGAYFDHIRDVHLKAQANQDVPFEQLVERLKAPRASNHSPLFQIIMTTNTDYGVAGEDAQAFSMPGVEIEPFEAASAAKFDLQVDLSISEQGLGLSWNFDTSLFKREHIALFNEHLCRLLEGISQIKAEQAINDLPMLSELETDRQLTELNVVHQTYAQNKSVHQLFEQQAEQNPQNPAVVLAENQLSYAELNQKANQLAHYLKQNHNVNTDTLVGLCVERSLEMTVAMLAILKAGGAYVPLDPSYPKSRLNHMFNDCGFEVILSQSHLHDALSEFGGTILCVDGLATNDDHFCSAFEQGNLNVPVGNSDLAYVIYTSGSTGMPKGVLTEHRSVVRLVDDCQFLELNPATVMLQGANVAFDAATLEIWGPLLNGGRCVLYPSQLMANDVLNQTLVEHQVNTLWLTAGLFSQWSYEVPQTSALRFVLAGGDVLDIDAIKRVQASLPEVAIINGYGPTENTTFSTTYQFANPYNSEIVPIGKKLETDQAYVLDSAMQLVPFGCVGELYVGGDGLARGYLNRDDLTKERFVENPFNDTKLPNRSSRLYKTGDLVHFLPDGNLAFVGRSDSQVKIRGYRIELGEIENQLCALDAVDSALVMARDIAGANQLVAYIKAQGEQPQNMQESVLAVLKNAMPQYMVPAFVMVVEQWPLTANGKIDKKALPQPEGYAEQVEYVAPASDNEKALAAIWAGLLNIEQDKISVKANFFELGGHSLLSMRLVGEIREQCRLEVSVQQIFDNAELSELAKEMDKSAQAVVRPPLVAMDRTIDIAPVSFSQQRVWFIDSIQGGSAEYNVPVAFNVEGQLNVGLLNRVFNTIIERHEVIRSVYIEQDGQTMQKRLDMSEVNFAVAEIDLTSLSGEQLDNEVKRRVEEDVTTSFDLANDVMLRVKYFKTSENLGVLTFNMHHIASDGWSMEMFTKEFFTLYRAYHEGRDNPFEPLQFQYADYAHWQNEFIAGEVLESQIDYWQKQLDDLPAVHSIPLDFPRPEIKQHVGKKIASELSGEVASRLLNLAKSHKMTPFMLLHGALSLVLSRHSNSRDIVIGTPVANRLQSELEPLIGYFVNTLVLRLNTEHSTVADYFEHVRDVHIGAQSNQDVPFEQLVDKLDAPRSRSFSPLFQIMMAINADYGLNDESEEASFFIPGIEVEQYQADVVQAKFDLDIEVKISEQGLRVIWFYDAALFSDEHIAQINQHACSLLEAMSQLSTEVPLSQLPMLSHDELDHLLYELNDTAKDYDKQACIHQLFEQQAKENPEQTAIVFEDEQLTYRQLNAKANQLANYLAEHHQVKPETLVGLCLERSLEMTIGILAILKAGGAYVPLDPSYPQDRINYMLDDAKMSVVLTKGNVQAVLEGYQGSILNLDGVGQSDNHFCANYVSENPLDTGLNSSNLAYVIYTSGSTGKPKGVMVEHQALFNRVHWMNNEYGMKAGDKVLQKTPYSFDVSVWEFVWPLAYGGQIVVAKPDGHKDPEYLCTLIQQQGVTKLHFVPSMLGVILESERFAQCHSIEQVFCSGEALQIGQVNGFKAALPDAQLHNLYGPTEAAIDVSYFDCGVDVSKGVPIGRPIDNIQLMVLDSDLNMVPKGAIGELHIGGDGLARGYLGRQDLTEERFIQSPFFDSDKANSARRLYKTGDLARINRSGEIEYQGRTDFQVKIRGLRIELGEIEHQLANLPEVDSALVLASELLGSMQLVAYVKTFDNSKEAGLVKSDIKAKLIENLPEHMVPGIIMVVDQWPTTANGKVDRKALPQPDAANLNGELIAPSTDTEIKLVALIAQLLGADEAEIGINIGLQDVGAHSLILIKACREINQHFDVNLTIKELYEKNTIEELARKIETLSAFVVEADELEDEDYEDFSL